MTRQEKKDWLAKADAEQLLRQFESAVRRNDNAWELMKRGESLEDIVEDYELAEKELLKRLNK